MHPTALPSAIEVYVFGAFTLDARRRSLSHGTSEVPLGSRALDLLIVLVEQSGVVLSRDHLVTRVWPRTIVEESSLRVHIAALRKALQDSSAESRYIANVPGRGYCFVGHVVRESRPVPSTILDRAMFPRLLGRDSTLAALEAMVQRCPVVSIVGPAGMGKTSVAQHASARLGPAFAGGVHWIDLAQPRIASIATHVAALLGIPGSDPFTFASGLRHTELLLVLDHCEHVLEEVAELVDAIVSLAPLARLICTSREPLNVAGEHVLRLDPLAVPPATAQTLAEALQAPAVALLVERARATGDVVVFDDGDVQDLRELCRQLDGIPLALELAAWRVAALGLKGLLARPNDWLALLSRGRRGAQPRHQSLRAAIDWSFALLDDTERQVLCCLSVFATPFSLTSGAAVVMMPQRPSRVEEVVLRLVDKSLLSPCSDAPDADDRTCYRLLHTTRSYAMERLDQLAEAGAVRARHAQEMQRLASRRSSAVVEFRAGTKNLTV